MSKRPTTGSLIRRLKALAKASDRLVKEPEAIEFPLLLSLKLDKAEAGIKAMIATLRKRLK